MCPTHAYVRFEDDKLFYTCKATDIKNLIPKNNGDFEKQKLYNVKWKDGQYYKAQIVFLAGE